MSRGERNYGIFGHGIGSGVVIETATDERVVVRMFGFYRILSSFLVFLLVSW